MEPQLSAALIAGGQGRRLGGVEKGLLRRADGRTVAQGLLELLHTVAGEVLLNTNRPQPYAHLSPAPKWVGDAYGERGAPGGVVSALAAATHPWVLVVAVDMPGVDAGLLSRLLAHPRDALEVVCFARQGDLEPLLGLYRASLAAAWAPRLVANPSLRALVASARFEALEVGEHPGLRSLNTPEDLAAVGAALPSP